MKKKLFNVLSFSVATVIIVGLLAGCGNEPSNGEVITFWGDTNQYTAAYYKSMCNEYNATQGKIDGITVDYTPKGSDYGSTLSTTLSGNSAPDVVIISDKYFKNYADQNFFVDLNGYLSNASLTTKNEAGEKNLDLADIAHAAVNRYRYDVTSKVAASPDSALYALPNGSNPTFLCYNKNYFSAAGINIISIAEDELEAYNCENGTN